MNLLVIKYIRCYSYSVLRGYSCSSLLSHESSHAPILRIKPSPRGFELREVLKFTLVFFELMVMSDEGPRCNFASCVVVQTST
jgi:hypothetical protein